MRYLFFGLTICILAISCQSIDPATPPKTIISEDQMVDILTDIAFVRAAKVSQKKILEQHKFNPEQYVLSWHAIDSTTFAENNAWYARNITQYQAIFTRVKENLENCKIEYEALVKEEKAAEKKRKDSLKKIKTDSEKK